MDGRSLLPLFGGDAGQWRDSFLIEYYGDTVFPRMRKMGYKAVRTVRHKYIRYTDLADMDEHYDLLEYPYELRNMLRTPEGRAALPLLQAELNRLMNAGPN